MREILFRGQRCDNGEWVQGFYVRADYHWHKHGIHKDWIICGAAANGGWFALHNKYPVKTETVGQFTGLTDKNGKKIFEGDILNSYDDEVDFIVEFNNGCFNGVSYATKGAMMEYGWDECAGGYGVVECEPLESYHPRKYHEVIGNIHESPELLEV